MSPLITVVIPTYNRAHLLDRAIRSVLDQSFRDWELVIADDGSTDDTARVVDAFGDRRIRYVRRDQNGGNAAARNTGVTAARGPLVSFLDSDDEYLPHFLEEVAAAMESAPPHVGFAWTGIARVSDSERGESYVSEEIWNPQSGESPYHLFLRDLRIGTNHGLTIKKECFAPVGAFDERIRAHVDKEFLIRLAAKFEFRVIPKILVRHHDHGGQRVSQNALDKAASNAVVIDVHERALREDPKLWVTWHQRAGVHFYQGGDKARGRRYMLRALRRAPLAPKLWVLMALFETRGPRKGNLLRQKLRHLSAVVSR